MGEIATVNCLLSDEIARSVQLAIAFVSFVKQV